MPRLPAAAAAAAFLLGVAGCFGGPPSSAPGAGAQAPVAMGGIPGDPVGFLLEAHDSLHLADSTVEQLRRLNLRLYLRNAAVQMSIDTTLRSAHFDPTGVRDTTAVPADLRQRLDPLFQQRREQTAAVRDTAYALLTPAQRDSARTLFERMMNRRRSGSRQTPDAGRPPDRP